MNLFIYQLFFLILIYIKSGHNYPTGAPPDVCDTMFPGHGVNSQTCSAKYTIQSDKSQYYNNETVRITISGSTSSDTFRGFLLIAKTQTSAQVIGTWSLVSSGIQTIACGGTANTGVTHTSADTKSSIVAVWTPPSTIPTENTIIKATVVNIQTLIYVDCFSVALTARQNTQSTSVTAATTVASATTTTATTSQTGDVGVNIGWTYANGVTTVKMQVNNLKTSQWTALGLSLDQSMGEDHIFVCRRLSDDSVVVDRRINPGGYVVPVAVTTISNPGGTFTATRQSLINGVVYCEFTLSGFSGTKRRRRAISSLSQSQTYYPLIAIGNCDATNGLIYHLTRSALSQTVQLNQQETINYNAEYENTNLMKAHGIIMIFTWILFVSTGILIARHFKPVSPDKKICGKAIWFAVHRALMTSVAVLVIIAFILILVYEKGKWVPQSTPREFAHSIVGIITICFAIIQPLMALFRCTPDAPNRFIFNYAHRTLGFSALILSVVAIFIAMFFEQFMFQIRKEWAILIGWSCWLPIIFFIFWAIDFYFQRNAKKPDNPNSYDLDDQNGHAEANKEPAPLVHNATQDRIKLFFLSIHIIVALGIALALAILIGRV